MNDTLQTQAYLKSLDAILIKEDYFVSPCIVDSKITVTLRKIYRKRNGKTCYVDCNPKHLDVDFNRIYYKTKHKSIEMNEHRTYHYSSSTMFFKPGYKEELIEKYKLLTY